MLQTLKNPPTMKMIACSNCGSPMPELRLTKYGYDYCVKCSEAGLGEGKKHGIPVLMGEGDHTWVETVIMNTAQYESYMAQKNEEHKLDKTNKAEKLDLDKDERNLQGPFQIINNTDKDRT